MGQLFSIGQNSSSQSGWATVRCLEGHRGKCAMEDAAGHPKAGILKAGRVVFNIKANDSPSLPDLLTYLMDQHGMSRANLVSQGFESLSRHQHSLG